jgi:hypothetical protein
MLASMSTTRLKRAAPNTLLGLLQRGRGKGFLAALGTHPARLHSLLAKCLTNDPRDDTQVEDRSLYYANFMFRTEMHDLTVIAQFLGGMGEEAARVTGDGWLAVYTLGRLAQRGHKNALSILRHQVCAIR